MFFEPFNTLVIRFVADDRTADKTNEDQKEMIQTHVGISRVLAKAQSPLHRLDFDTGS
jgi:hypothetical protein